MLVLVTPPGATLPIELRNDVMVVDEPLPSTDDLARLVTDTFGSANVSEPDQATISKAVDALIGLAAFPAEQVLALSFSKDGLDLDRLWERKCQAIEQTPGLAIWRGGETFDQIGGCENIKCFLTAVLDGREAPRVIVSVDEIEKGFAGTGTDMSGVKTEMTGTMLGWMQDRGADGVIFIISLSTTPRACASPYLSRLCLDRRNHGWRTVRILRAIPSLVVTKLELIEAALVGTVGCTQRCPRLTRLDSSRYSWV